MKRALISDIHGNIEALTAVVADIQSQDISEVFCLGDVIGYGPNPCECIDKVMELTKMCILGNHDQGALFDPEGFSSGAERAIFWTRSQLERNNDGDKNVRRWAYLCELNRTYRDGDMLFVHGSARSPLNEYVFPEDVYNAKKLEKIFSLIPKHCFQGHTHVPGVFTEDSRFYSPTDLGGRYRLTDQKAMINVGSVGQPRDSDTRSCYVVVDEETVEFRRVEYPIDTTVAKIHSIPELDDFLGDRLREGR